jgi:hypothetical protein
MLKGFITNKEDQNEISVQPKKATNICKFGALQGSLNLKIKFMSGKVIDCKVSKIFKINHE